MCYLFAAIAFLLVFPCFAPRAGGQALPEGGGSYVTRLGDDTLAVEQFRYGPTSFAADVMLRTPRTVLMRYQGEVDERGNLTSLSASRYDLSEPEPVRVEHATYLFGPDSVVIQVEEGDEVRRQAVAAEPGAIPFIDMVHWPFELSFARAAGTVGEFEQTMIAGRNAQTFVLGRETDGEAVIRHPYRGTTRAQVDERGQILSVDGVGTTRALTLERVNDLDVEALAREFASRDVRGDVFGPLSGRAEAEGEIGGAHVVVDYGVPSKRGREIFGALVPYGEVWRTGANRATHFTTNRDVRIGSAEIPAGTYTLFTIPGPTEWTLIVNRRTDITGTAHDPAADVVRIPMEVRDLAETVEDFTIVVDPSGFLRLQWDRTEAVVPVAR